MCDRHAISSAPEGGKSGRSRLRLWEVMGGYHCSLLGTCLSLETARAALRKARTPGLSRMSDYEVHSAAVSAAQAPGPIAKRLDKALARAHEPALRRYAKLQSLEAVREAWRADLRAGFVPGPFFAVMTHPITDAALRTEAFGQVHMLSHQIGAGNRERLRRYDDISARVEALETALSEEKRARQLERAQLTDTIQSLEMHLVEARAQAANRNVSGPSERGPVETSSPVADGRERALARAERKLAHALDALASARAEADALRARLDEQNAAAKTREREAPKTVSAMRCVPLAQAIGEGRPAEATSFCSERNSPCDLRGSVILYVGGEKGMVPHLRRLAEAANVCFLHHDGGREDGLRSLPRLCARADAVLCPIDRVGHVAVDTLKRACSSAQKTFIPLRRASLEAFERGLLELAAPSSRGRAGSLRQASNGAPRGPDGAQAAEALA